jgi:LysM repeat protein
LYLPTEEESTPTSTNTYVVKSGDTLYSIANKNNTTVDELKTLNNLSSNTLSIGQVLKLPFTTITYTVVKGDTLYSIAQKYNTTVSSIETLNNLSTSNLSIGQKLIIKS